MKNYDGVYLNRNFVKGENGHFEVINPYNQEVLGVVSCASKAQIKEAISSASKALEAYEELNAWELSEKLLSIAKGLQENLDPMARIISQETGKPLAQSIREVTLSYEQFIWFGEQTKRIKGQVLQSRNPSCEVYVKYEPIGIVAAFASWNFPLLLMARKIAPALGARCPIILHGNESAPLCGIKLFEIMHKANLPEGMVSLLCGEPNMISDTLMHDERVRKVSLTGSIPVGKKLISASSHTIKKVTMELGGHAPVLIYDDVDIKALAKLSVRVKFANAGQVCVSPTRFFVHERVASAFCEAFVQEVKTIKLGNGLDKDTDMGPLINQKRLDAMEAFIQEAKEMGGEILCGGKRPEGFSKGYFFEPTVIWNLPFSSSLFCNEIFGPIALISSFSDADPIFKTINQTPYGLASYVFTNSLERAHVASKKIQAGMVGVNSFGLAAAEIPFGGIKASGFGRESGEEGLYEYLCSKIITQQYQI